MIKEGFIFTEYIPEFQNKIKTLNKRAFKLGVDFIKVIVTNETKTEIIKRENKPNLSYHFTKVICEGETPCLAGWSLVATVVLDKDLGTMINVVPGKELDPKYRETKGECQHCNKVRPRNETFVVEHEVEGTKIVGRSCLKDFLPTEKIDKFMWAMSWPKSADDLFGEFSDFDRCPRVEPVWNMTHFIAVGLRVISEYGYVTVAKAQESDEFNPLCATKDRMYLALEGNYHCSPVIPKVIPTEEEMNEAKKIIEWAKGYFTPDKGDYAYNLSMILKAEIIKSRFFGYLVSIIPQYNRVMELYITKEKKKPSEFVGEVGQRINFNLTFLNVWGFNTSFGWLNIYKFQDKEGNVFVWKSGNAEDFEQGKEYTLKGTIKKT